MNKIKIMDQDLANKIAAGEVIENPKSVVKELVENSIDANAKKIEIILIDGGLQLIQIIDNGEGMSKEDLLLCIKPHASSKLHSVYDLFNIQTLGFRGEALASIVSVAKVKISTNNSSNEGYNLSNENNEIKVSLGYALKGTKISIYNLFYNVPARLKYLKAQSSELSNIVALVNQMALCYPEISFSLTNNNKKLLTTNGNGNIIEVAKAIYSLDIAKSLIPLRFENNDFKIKGYLSDQNHTRSNKKGINIFINKRLIVDKDLTNAIIKGYQQLLMEHRYPIVFIDITCDYQLIDVNVHPAKKEVRISKIDELCTLITNNIKEQFNITSKTFIKQAIIKQPQLFDSAPIIKEDHTDYLNHSTTSSITISTSNNNLNISIPDEELSIKPLDIDVEVIPSNIIIDTTEEILLDEVNPSSNQIQYHEFRALAQFNASYIIAQSNHGLHLIDQHAAMERINYESSLSLFKNDNTQFNLITPLIIKLSSSEKIKLSGLQTTLLNFGLIYEEQANNDIIFRSIPNWIEHKQAQQSIEASLDYVLGLNIKDGYHIKEEQLISQACQKSLKANQVLSINEQQALIDELIKTNNYSHCPHGRPIIITYSLYEIEKLFKRVV